MASARGLVHIKGYYILFKTKDGTNKYKRRFIFGSGNATDAAFSGYKNAELLSVVDLVLPRDKDIVEYCRSISGALSKGGGTVASLQSVPLSRAVTLYLPSFSVVMPGESSGFDTWLQSGVLAAKYRDQQNFLKFSIKLSKQLPRGATARALADQRLVPDGKRDTLRFSYIEEQDVPAGKPKWKARYSLWTHFGDWISDDCFRAEKKQMELGSSDVRRGRIDVVKQSGNNKIWLAARRAELMESLRKGWAAIEDNKGRPDEYFATQGGRIDRGRYEEMFVKKLSADYRLALSDDFYSRYVNGFEFPRVPKFRQDAAAWEAFVISWCESLKVEIDKSDTRSLIAKSVRALADRKDDLLNFEPADLAKWLRDDWDSLSERLTRYFSPPRTEL